MKTQNLLILPICLAVQQAYSVQKTHPLSIKTVNDSLVIELGIPVKNNPNQKPHFNTSTIFKLYKNIRLTT